MGRHVDRWIGRLGRLGRLGRVGTVEGRYSRGQADMEMDR